MEITTTTTTNIGFHLSKIQDFMDRSYNTGCIKDNLLVYPNAIAKQKANVRKIRDAFQEADLPRQMMELEMIDDIAAATNAGTGKALYSNDKLRDSELKRRKANDEFYQDLHRKAKEAERDLSAAEDELERLNNSFAAYRHVSNFVSAEMNLVAAIMEIGGIGGKQQSDIDDNARFWPTEKAIGEAKTDGQPF